MIQASPTRAPVVTALHCDLVVRAHGEDRLHVLLLLHGALRHQDGARALGHLHADAAELAGKQGVLRVGESRLQFAVCRSWGPPG